MFSCEQNIICGLSVCAKNSSVQSMLTVNHTRDPPLTNTSTEAVLLSIRLSYKVIISFPFLCSWNIKHVIHARNKLCSKSIKLHRTLNRTYLQRHGIKLRA